MSNAAADFAKESNFLLSKEAIKTIEQIISSGNDARISSGKRGLVVYAEKITKKYSQS